MKALAETDQSLVQYLHGSQHRLHAPEPRRLTKLLRGPSGIVHQDLAGTVYRHDHHVAKVTQELLDQLPYVDPLGNRLIQFLERGGAIAIH